MIRADLTEVEKQADLEDQYAALRHDPKKIVLFLVLRYQPRPTGR